jgi:hypothetical protein
LEFLETGWVRDGYPGQWGTSCENEVVFWDEYITYHWFMDFIRDEFQVDILWKFVKELRRFSFFSEPRDNHQLAKCLAHAVLHNDMRVLRFGRDLYGRRDWNDPDYTPMVGLFLPVKPKETKPEPPVRKVEDPYGPIRIRVVEDSTGKPIPNVKISFFGDDPSPIYTSSEGIAEASNVLGRFYVAQCPLIGEPLSQTLHYLGEGETPICPSEESEEHSEPDSSTEEASNSDSSSSSSSSPPEFHIAHVKENKRKKWEMEWVRINEPRTVRVRLPKKVKVIAIEAREPFRLCEAAVFKVSKYDGTPTEADKSRIRWFIRDAASRDDLLTPNKAVIKEAGEELKIDCVPFDWHDRTIEIGAQFGSPPKNKMFSGKAKYGPFADLRMLEVAARLDGYDTRQCITALRKIWYNDDRRPVKTIFGVIVGGGGWSILIPGASSTPLPPRWSQDNLAKIVEHARSANERNVEGSTVDVGHLFAGLDAGNYPTSIQLAGGLVKMRSNKEAATFVGDLGSVVAEYIHRSKSSMYDTANIKQETLLDHTYADRASDADMNGNADAYACCILPGKSVCDALDAYYAPNDTGVSRRYAKLKEYLKDTSNQLREEVFNAALAYAASKKWIADVGLVLNEPGPGFLAPTYWDLYWNVSGWVCDYFLGRVSKLAEGVD